MSLLPVARNMNEVEQADANVVRLMLLAVSGFIAAFGVGLIGWYSAGTAAAALLAGLVLVLTALVLMRLAMKLDPVEAPASDQGDVIDALTLALPQATFITDFEGHIHACSAEARAMFPSGAVGLFELVPSQTHNGLRRLLQSVRSQGRGDGVVTPIVSTDQAHLRGVRVGRMLLWQCETIQDPIQEASAALDAAAWLSPVFEMAGIGLAVQNSGGIVIYASEELRRWLGLTSEEALPDAIRIREKLGQVLIGGRKLLEADITSFPLHTAVDMPEDGHKQLPAPPPGRLMLLRREGHNNLRPNRDHQWLDSLLDRAPIAVAIVDEQGLIRDFNQPLQAYVGERKLQAGMDVTDLVAAEERQHLTQLIQNVQRGEQVTTTMDVHFILTEDRVGELSFAVVEIEAKLYPVLFFVDYTQQKSLEQQFVQAQKMQAIGQLAGGVAHDFNNLLTAIIGYCDLLLGRHDVGDQSFSDLMQIKQNANRAANLVRQLLAFSRQQTLRPKVLVLADVLADLSNLLRRLIGEKIELDIRHGRDLPSVKVDQGQLDQVIINLAVNARDAMPDGGMLCIRSSFVAANSSLFKRFGQMEQKDYVLIEIQDSGIGIPMENQAKVFEPFFTTKEVGRGTGLGLATVYGIVKQTGGNVFLESTPGEGTSFFIFLPAHHLSAEEQSDTAEKPEARAKDLSGRGTILLVEDEVPVRMLANRALKLRGYTVLEAESGDAALDLMDETDAPIDLLISDVVMPNMDGPALMVEARKRNPDLPVIFISGYAEDMVRKSLEAEDVQFLQKPFELKALAELVKETLNPE